MVGPAGVAGGQVPAKPHKLELVAATMIGPDGYFLRGVDLVAYDKVPPLDHQWQGKAVFAQPLLDGRRGIALFLERGVGEPTLEPPHSERAILLGVAIGRARVRSHMIDNCAWVVRLNRVPLSMLFGHASRVEARVIKGPVDAVPNDSIRFLRAGLRQVRGQGRWHDDTDASEEETPEHRHAL